MNNSSNSILNKKKQYTEEEIKNKLSLLDPWKYTEIITIVEQLLESNKTLQQTLDTILDKFPCSKTIN